MQGLFPDVVQSVRMFGAALLAPKKDMKAQSMSFINGISNADAGSLAKSEEVGRKEA